MPLNISYKVRNNTFLVSKGGSFKKRIEDALFKGLHKGADELRDYIKDDLLSGQIVQKRTSQLRNSLYIRRSSKKLEILFRGIHRQRKDTGNNIPNKVLAQILEEGLNKSWWQPRRNRWHRGIKPHYFMRTGLRRKRARIIQIAQTSVNAELRRR